MLSRILRGLVDFFYPKRCLGCGATLNKNSLSEIICISCLNSIKKNAPPFCSVCGRHLFKESFSSGICPRCTKEKLYFDRAYSVCTYEGTVKELIRQLKYCNKIYVAKFLSGLMSGFIREYGLTLNNIDAVIALPLHRSRLREREFNQSEELAKFIAEDFTKPLSSNALEKIKNTKSQTELKDFERFKNIKGSFKANKEAVQGKNILLIDDVLTTGATVSEASYALKESGANKVIVLTLAN